MEPVSSTRNQHVVRAGRLHRARTRRQWGETLVEGPHILADAAAAGISISEVFGLAEDVDAQLLAEASGARWIPVTPHVLARIADTESPRGPIGIIEIPEDRAPVGDRVWLATADPGNTGTLIRTAAAFGLSVVIDVDAVDPWSPKVIRSGAGGHFRAPVSTGAPVGAFTIATTMSGDVPSYRLGEHLPETGPVCVMVGNEAHGLDHRSIEQADLTVSIPMPGGSESLNAAVAGALCMYELMLARRSRRAGKPVRGD